MEGLPFDGSPMEGLPFAPSPIGDSAAKAMPAEAAMMPKAAVAANTEAVVFFMISPETDVMRDVVHDPDRRARHHVTALTLTLQHFLTMEKGFS